MSIKHLCPLLLPALLFSESVLAHSKIENIGDFYNGLLHPVLVPAHLLLLLGAGLLWEQLGLKKIEWPLLAFTVATFTGLVAAWFSLGSGTETVILGLTVVVGLMLVINLEVNPAVATVLHIITALLAGFLVGIDSVQDELSGKGKFIALFGSSIAILFLAFYPMALADYFSKTAWKKTGVRIIGSWIAASSILVLSLSLSVKAQ